MISKVFKIEWILNRKNILSQFAYKFQDWSWNVINICFLQWTEPVWKWNSGRQFPLHNRAGKSSWVLTGYRYSYKCCQFAYFTYFINDNVLSYTLAGVWGIQKQPLHKNSWKVNLPDETCFVSLFMKWFLRIWNNYDMTWQVSSGKISFEKHLYDAFKMKNMCFSCHFEKGSRSRSLGAWALTLHHT